MHMPRKDGQPLSWSEAAGSLLTNDAALFESVMLTVCKYISQTGDLSFFSDGERRYGNTLFAFCAEALRNGKPDRPPKTLPKGIKLRVKIDKRRLRG